MLVTRLCVIIAFSQASGNLLKKNQSRAMRVILDSRNIKLSNLLTNTHTTVDAASGKLKATTSDAVPSFEHLSSRLLKVVLGRLHTARRTASVAYDDFTAAETADDLFGTQSADDIEHVCDVPLVVFSVC